MFNTNNTVSNPTVTANVTKVINIYHSDHSEQPRRGLADLQLPPPHATNSETNANHSETNATLPTHIETNAMPLTRIEDADESKLSKGDGQATDATSNDKENLNADGGNEQSQDQPLPSLPNHAGGQSFVVNEHRVEQLTDSDIDVILKYVRVPPTANARVTSLLSSIAWEWNFDVFEFVELCGNLSLALLMCSIGTARNIFNNMPCVPMPQLVFYMNSVDAKYQSVPFHNRTHAADVLLNINYMLDSGVFRHVAAIDAFAILVAAAVHDVGHPGHGNSFEINTESQLAMFYNDHSVLEQMHANLAWRLLKEKGADFLVHFDKPQKKRFRKILIESILATDMSQHSTLSVTLESLAEQYPKLSMAPKESVEKFSNQFLPIALHTADLGNLCKPIEYYTQWVDRLMQEFFNQGDNERELNLDISFGCDRFAVNKHHSQVAFIKLVVQPWYQSFGKILPEASHNQLFLDHLNDNLKYMETRSRKRSMKHSADDSDFRKVRKVRKAAQ